MLGLMGLSLLIWIILVTLRDGFWKTDQRLPEVGDYFQHHPAPSIAIVIPARNEADLLPQTLRSLLTQDYPGEVAIVLVDDHSSDRTGEIARALFATAGRSNCKVIDGEALPIGWTGKLWALEQGIRSSNRSTYRSTYRSTQDSTQDSTHDATYVLLTDADIFHAPDSLSKLMHQAVTQDCDLVSLMVKLRTESLWERWLIPAFVFFFAKLYPFRAVNNPKRSIGAAAGGCSLIRRSALEKIGGISAIRGALIDDCTLGQAIKSGGNGRIWLGLTTETLSLRAYDSLESIWAMVTRSAYAQLNYSPLLLLGTAIGMALVYGMPIVGLVMGWIDGIRSQDWRLEILAVIAYGLMTIAYGPMVRFYQQPGWMSLGLPGVAFLYWLMTMDSARQALFGQGGSWKGRIYPRTPTP
jgi:hopene-associated glycosyltransferase HpnB